MLLRFPFHHWVTLSSFILTLQCDLVSASRSTSKFLFIFLYLRYSFSLTRQIHWLSSRGYLDDFILLCLGIVRRLWEPPRLPKILILRISLELIKVLRLSGPLTDANFGHFNWFGILLLTDLFSGDVVHLRLFDAIKVIAFDHLVVRFLFEQALLKAPLERQLIFKGNTAVLAALIMGKLFLWGTACISGLGLVVVGSWARLERLLADWVLAVAKPVLHTQLKRTWHLTVWVFQNLGTRF